MYTSVLVVVDRQEGSDGLLHAALALTDPERGWVTLMATSTVRPIWSHSMAPFTVPMPTKDELARQAESLLDHLARRTERRARLATVVHEENLASAIVARVAAASHDLVVVAADSLRQPCWPLTSRGTAALLRRTDVPLLIIPHTPKRS